MYRLQVKDRDYNKFNFIFNSMEEIGVFASTVLATSINDNVEVVIKKEVNEDAETL